MNVIHSNGLVIEYERLLTAKEAAFMLRVHEKTLLKWARHGLIPHFRMGSIIRFKREDIQARAE